MDSSGEIINTTITSNFADTGGGLFNRSSSPAITNSIVSGNRKATSVFDCELMQYPCTIADTPEEIRAATVDVLMDALRVRHASSMEDAIAFLASVPEMAEVLGGNDAIRFRLRGGAPAWLTDVSVGDTSTTKAAVKRPADLKHIPTGAGFQAKVVGEDSNRDGKIDNEDTKRALLLAPFEWQFSSDETRLISGNLMGLPAYEGNVRFVSNPDTFNQNVELADFQSWDDYDFIFVSSHGSRECRESDFTEQSWCGVAINTGIVVSTPTMSIPGILYGVAYSQKEVDELGFTPERLIKVMVTGPFFRTHYPNGLDNSVVILSACETGGRFAGAFAEDLGGEDFVMVAWSEKVPVPDAFSASTMLVEELVNGLTTEEALQKLDEAGLRAVLNNNLETAEFTRYAPNGGDQRIIELPTILHEGKEMLDDTDIALLVEGTPGDEVNDRLNLDLRVKGVLPDKKDQYQIRYEVGGRQATGTYDLASASEAEGYAYVVEHDVDLGFPLESGPLKLEAIVDLPEGGESRFQVDATVGRCFWRLEIGGPQGGVYSGKWAEFDFVTGLITLNPNSGFDPVSSILVELFNPGGTSNLGPFLLSRDGKDDGHSVIFFRGSYDYLTGDGSEKKDSQGNVQFVFPDPSSLSLTSRSEIVIEGSIDGSYWGGPTGDPATWETVNVSVTFRAQNFLLPDLCGS